MLLPKTVLNVAVVITNARQGLYQKRKASTLSTLKNVPIVERVSKSITVRLGLFIKHRSLVETKD